MLFFTFYYASQYDYQMFISLSYSIIYKASPFPLHQSHIQTNQKPPQHIYSQQIDFQCNDNISDQIQMDIEKTKQRRKHVQWDEQKLKETEKDRGKYQKIDEPKTPYRRNSNDSIEEMQIEVNKTQEELEIENSLKAAQKNRESNRRGRIDLAALNAKLKQEMAQYHEPEEMQEEENQEQKKKKEQFKKKRAQHYNQYKMVRQARKDNWDDSDDD